MAQRVDVVAVRPTGARVVLADQASDSDALWKRLRTLGQTCSSIEITKRVLKPPTPVPVVGSGQRVVYFSSVTDAACGEFAACGPGYTARLSADLNQSGPGGAYFATDEQIRTLRSKGARVEGWADGDQTPISALIAFVRARGLDGATAQFETIPQWRAFRATPGLTEAIGNPAALLGDVALQEAIADAYAGRVHLIGEVLEPNPGYSAQGIPISSGCFYVDRDDRFGGYVPLAAYASMPPSFRASCSVYTGGRMTAEDWNVFRTWTRGA